MDTQRRVRRIFVMIIAVTSLFGCSKQDSALPPDDKSEQPAQVIESVESPAKVNEEPLAEIPPGEFATIEWTDLIPKDDLDALMNPPDYLNDIVDGSAEDQISSQLQDSGSTSEDRYQQALSSTEIVAEMDGRAVRIPGFIVPIEFDDDLSITQFFLVPFFGACMHLPPPPPNQVVFVEYPQGLQLDALYDPFWISGTLKTSIVQNELATAAYTMRMNRFENYYDEEEM